MDANPPLAKAFLDAFQMLMMLPVVVVVCVIWVLGNLLLVILKILGVTSEGWRRPEEPRRYHVECPFEPQPYRIVEGVEEGVGDVEEGVWYVEEGVGYVEDGDRWWEWEGNEEEEERPEPARARMRGRYAPMKHPMWFREKRKYEVEAQRRVKQVTLRVKRVRGA